jgi:hypothetical protein
MQLSLESNNPLLGDLRRGLLAVSHHLLGLLKVAVLKIVRILGHGVPDVSKETRV